MPSFASATPCARPKSARRAENGEALLLETRLRELAAAQNEIAGRFSQAIESQSRSQGDLQRAMAERLEALDKRLGENLKESAAKTAETLGGLQLRLRPDRRGAEEPDRSLRPGRRPAADPRPTSRRAAPTARARWKPSCAMRCPRASSSSRRRSPTRTGPTASSGFPAARRASSSIPNSRWKRSSS